MFPSVIVKAFTLVFGYAYPGYKCFKALRKRRADIKDLTFWCRYWVLIAVGTTAEFLADPIFSWIPMYPEAKLAVVVFLWHPHTMGADYVYDRFLLPFLCLHEANIDRHLKECQETMQAATNQMWQQACMHAQVQFMEFIAYLSSLSTEAARQSYAERGPLTLQRPQVRELTGWNDEEYHMVQRADAAGPILQEIEGEEGSAYSAVQDVFTDGDNPTQGSPPVPLSSMPPGGVDWNARGRGRVISELQEQTVVGADMEADEEVHLVKRLRPRRRNTAVVT